MGICELLSPHYSWKILLTPYHVVLWCLLARRNRSQVRQSDRLRWFPFVLNSRRTHTAFAIALSGTYMKRWSRPKNLRARFAQISIYPRHHGQTQSQRRYARN